MTKIKCFPFPDRNPDFKIEDIYYIKNKSAAYITSYYIKNTSVDSLTIANQFFSIENILIDSFEFVLPIKKNSKTCSVKFATIIRESCNLYEIISKRLYLKFFKVSEKAKPDIFNFLSLDVFMDLSKEKLRAPVLESYLENNEKIEPFYSLINWNRQEALQKEHVPKWWTAYNKIKHDFESIPEFASLDNAINSLSAVFLLIRKVYGDGLICGFLRQKENDNTNTILYPIRTSNIFIGEILKEAKI